MRCLCAVLCPVTNILAEAHSGNAAKQNKLKALNSFMRSKGLPFDLQVRIRRFFRFFWSRSLTSEISEDEILEQLSVPLRHETLKIMYATLDHEVPMFTITDDDNFRNALLRIMSPVLLDEGEMLMTQGTVGDYLYLVTHGLLEVTYTPFDAIGKLGYESQYLGQVGAGDHIGEIALFDKGDLVSLGETLAKRDGSPRAPQPAPLATPTDGWNFLAPDQRQVNDERAADAYERTRQRAQEALPYNVRTASVRAIVPCEAFSVRASDFQDVCSKFIEAKHKLVAIAQERIARSVALQLEAENDMHRSRLKVAKWATKLHLKAGVGHKHDPDDAVEQAERPSEPARKPQSVSKVLTQKILLGKAGGGAAKLAQGVVDVGSAKAEKLGRTTKGIVAWQQQQKKRAAEAQNVGLAGVDTEALAKMVANLVVETLQQQGVVPLPGARTLGPLGGMPLPRYHRRDQE